MGQRRTYLVHTVDPHGACLRLVRHLDSAHQVLRENGGYEAITRFILRI